MDCEGLYLFAVPYLLFFSLSLFIILPRVRNRVRIWRRKTRFLASFLINLVHVSLVCAIRCSPLVLLAMLTGNCLSLLHCYIIISLCLPWLAAFSSVQCSAALSVWLLPIFYSSLCLYFILNRPTQDVAVQNPPSGQFFLD